MKKLRHILRFNSWLYLPISIVIYLIALGISIFVREDSFADNFVNYMGMSILISLGIVAILGFLFGLVMTILDVIERRKSR